MIYVSWGYKLVPNKGGIGVKCNIIHLLWVLFTGWMWFTQNHIVRIGTDGTMILCLLYKLILVLLASSQKDMIWDEMVGIVAILWFIYWNEHISAFIGKTN